MLRGDGGVVLIGGGGGLTVFSLLAWALAWLALLVEETWGALFGGEARAVDAQRPSKALVRWHPHKDALATLGPDGAVAVHAVGGALAGGSSQYLHLHPDALGGALLCLEWQPNDLGGALAVGAAGGVGLWRRDALGGWRFVWSLQGPEFACPTAAWSPDGRHLAAVGAHGVVRVLPHSGPWHGGGPAVVLWRWRSGAAAGLAWSRDGAVLAATHEGRRPFVRLWGTRKWDIIMHIDLAPSHIGGPSSVGWWGDDVLIGRAAGRLFELGGVRAGRGDLTGGCEPLCRNPLPPLPQGLDGGVGGLDQTTIAEVAIDPRTRQCLAVRFEHSPAVLVLDGGAADGWGGQGLSLRGVLFPDDCLTGAGADGEGVRAAALAAGGARPRALAFAASAGGRSGGPGLVLAVYWDLGQGHEEVRTYPL